MHVNTKASWCLGVVGAFLLLVAPGGARGQSPDVSAKVSASQPGKEHQLRLYNILADLTGSVGKPGAEIDIVCGYRTSSTNEALRAHTTGVAKNSLHIQAEAIDLRMPGVDTIKLRKAALALGRGGVGYYPHSDFIHVDLGRVRQWCFECSASLLSGD